MPWLYHYCDYYFLCPPRYCSPMPWFHAHIFQTNKRFCLIGNRTIPPSLNRWLFQEEFDNDVDALLEEGMPVPKKMRPSEDKSGGESDHQSDGEEGIQPMMTKIKTVLKSEWWRFFLDIKRVYMLNEVKFVLLLISPVARSGTSTHWASTWWLDHDIP